MKESKEEQANKVFDELSNKIKTLIKEKTGKDVMMGKLEKCGIKGNLCSNCQYHLECAKLNMGITLGGLMLDHDKPTIDELISDMSDILEPILVTTDTNLLHLTESLGATLLTMRSEMSQKLTEFSISDLISTLGGFNDN